MEPMTLVRAAGLIGALLAYDRACGWFANGAKRLALTVVLAVYLSVLLNLSPVDASWFAAGIFVWRTHAEVRHPTWSEVPAVFARHAKYALLGLLAVLHFVGGAPVVITALSLVIFAAFAALLARGNRVCRDRGVDRNDVLEVLRGAGLGVSLATALAFA